MSKYTLKDAAKLYKQGLSLRDIEALTGYSYEWIRQYLIKQSVKLRPVGGQKV